MSFPRYPDYMDSGAEWLGCIPKHWGCELGRRLFAQSRLPAQPGDLQLSATQKYGVIPQQMFMELEDQKVVLALTGLDNFKHVEVDDFVISLRSFQGGIERCRYSGCVSPAYTVLNARHQVDPAFMEYLLKAPPFIAALQSVTDGIREGKSISYEQFGAVHLPIPSIEEQSSIAAFLTDETAKIDALVAEQEQLITLLKEKRQAVISHAVTKGLDPSVPMKNSGVEWLGEVPAHWAIAALNYRYEVLLGKMLDEKRILGNHLAPYLRNVDVQWDRINIDDLPQMDFDGSDVERYGLRAGDLLVCEGGDVGRSALWQGQLTECYYQKALHRLRPRDDSSDLPRFQFYLMQAAAKLDVFTGGQGKATIFHLTAEALRRYRFAYPGRAEQERIAEHLDRAVSKFDELINEATKATQLLQERRSALISAAVTGQIDVRRLVIERAAA